MQKDVWNGGKLFQRSYIETATPLREDGLFISLGGLKFFELELFASFLTHIVIVGDLIRFSAMGSEGKTSAFWDKMINEKFVANCLNISKMLKKGGEGHL